MESVREGAAQRTRADRARTASLAKANRRREEIAALRSEARASKLTTGQLLADARAARLRLVRVLPMVPSLSLDAAFEVLLACRINGARPCGKLSGEEREALVDAISQIGMGNAVPSRRALPGHPEGADRELDRVLAGTRRAAPVGLAPSEFAAARTGLEADPLLLRMVDRLVDAVRLYAERDDGGQRARIVAEQWIRYRNYIGRVACGELPPPTQRSPAAVE